EQNSVEHASNQVTEIDPTPVAEQLSESHFACHEARREQSEVPRGQLQTKQNQHHETHREESRAYNGRQPLRQDHHHQRRGIIKKYCCQDTSQQHVANVQAGLFLRHRKHLYHQLVRSNVVHLRSPYSWPSLVHFATLDQIQSLCFGTQVLHRSQAIATAQVMLGTA